MFLRIRSARAGRRRLRTWALAFVPMLLGPLAEHSVCASPDPRSVLIIVNDAVLPEAGTGAQGASLYVGLYYAQARNVPLSNIFHINLPMACCTFSPLAWDSWHVPWTDFKDKIRAPLKSFLEAGGLKNQIKYIVTTYGVPSHIWGHPYGFGFSVDGFLAALYADPPYQENPNAPNPVFDPNAASMPPHWSNLGRSTPVYAVTRLDGPSPALAVAMIDRAIQAEHGITRGSGIGYFDFRGIQPPSPSWMPSDYYDADQGVKNAFVSCANAGLDCILNNQPVTGGMISSAPNTLWAWGWYSGATTSNAYTFALGAVGAQLTSYTAISIRTMLAGAWVPLWISQGITATWGATDEPSVYPYTRGDVLLNRLWNGYTFGEAATMATPELSWMMVFIGDPLYSPVFVDPPMALNVVPSTAALVPGASQSFRARGVGSADVSWSLTPAAGTIDSQGNYRAPASVSGPTSVLVKAASASNPALTSSATVTVTPPALVPSANTLAPSSGTGTSALFLTQFSHPSGALAITTASLLVNTASATPSACLVRYDRATNSLRLYQDDGASFAALTPGSGQAQNSQCALDGTGSSVGLSGNNLTMTLAISFKFSFSGPKTVYLSASDAGTTLPWQAFGTWAVAFPPPNPSADAVSPNAATGVGQTFTFSFSDTQTAANLTGMAMLFSTGVTYPNACFIVVDRLAGTLALLWDTAAGSNARPLASSSVLENSQCAVGAVAVTDSNLSTSVSVAVTFKAGFSGVKDIYLFASEGSRTTGWTKRGTYTIISQGPSADSIQPASGSGTRQLFTVVGSDARGANYVTGLALLIAASLNPNNACRIVFDRAANTVSLAYDNAGGGASPMTPGSANVISNSQCALYGQSTSVTIGATTVALAVDVEFGPAFFGPKQTYAYVAEQNTSSGWVNRGAWTVPGGPSADAIAPVSGSGSYGTFTFTESDPVSPASLTGLYANITADQPGAFNSACVVVYDRPFGTIGLYDDLGQSVGSKVLGSSAALQNSQCAVGYAVMTSSGNALQLAVNLLFKPAFQGPKTVYLRAREGSAVSGWYAGAVWTVP